ncbi:hypothetical protein CHLRE_06g302389v5 [Chlamydomonas reinhardtii]|uniref:Uncharacterized protein n=1 Tax=Chlamydomonas reinhardtii TaxID=3055 RepID=A0A2K3DR21_CHLRE|nr:uncharacterized protein CHLRE_06g302389v5 [Chlamydomonas reinhardtii]PNW82995.1 hypothetical protein CHLRE_06g302389v5 [Chlamydomonas reinhardtii]
MGKGRDVNSATNIRHALVEMLLGNVRPASLQPGGGGGGGGGGPAAAQQHTATAARVRMLVRSGGDGNGHVEEESAASPKTWRKRAG